MNETNRKFAIITVDTNDGDYISKTIEVTPEQVLVLTNVVTAIKDFKPYKVVMHNITCTHVNNFPTGECLRDDLGELSAKDYYIEHEKTITAEDFESFIELLPYCEHGLHTIKEICVLAVIGEIKLM